MVPLPARESIEFVRIEAGTFLMGTPTEQIEEWRQYNEEGRRYRPTSFEDISYSIEWPQHQVTITRAFYLSKFEITLGQWWAVMDTSIHPGNPKYPRTNRSWLEIQNFIDILRERTGLPLRLPTEAEWEYAARAGTTTLWWSGDDPDEAEKRNCGGYRCGAYGNPTHMNPWGLYFVIGNVWEFTSDARREYDRWPRIDPIGPHPTEAEGFEKNRACMRGGDTGGWGQDRRLLPWYSRSAFRGSLDIERRLPWVGFRLLLEGESPNSVRENESWGKVKLILR